MTDEKRPTILTNSDVAELCRANLRFHAEGGVWFGNVISEDFADRVEDVVRVMAEELWRLRQYVENADAAVKYPGDDQRHPGTSTATQLVHCQHMREQAEADAALYKALVLNMEAERRALKAEAAHEANEALVRYFVTQINRLMPDVDGAGVPRERP